MLLTKDLKLESRGDRFYLFRPLFSKKYQSRDLLRCSKIINLNRM